MTRNLGYTSLKRSTRPGNPLNDFDNLPAELRGWLASAVLPWRPKTVHRVYKRTLAKNPDKAAALQTLSVIERRLVARDVQRVWGAGHPYLKSE